MISYEPHHTHLFLQNSSLQSCSAAVSHGKGRKHRHLWRRSSVSPIPALFLVLGQEAGCVHGQCTFQLYITHILTMAPENCRWTLRLGWITNMTWSAEDNCSLISGLSGLNAPLGQMVATFETAAWCTKTEHCG